ncbi:hypothetical protein Naga_100001g59 [Nannochloropsis gaditana]|uniref:DNA replication checkpoint mediator MRC1 domain-containing protein n=1 Tax=Nannochloropsis gaditana TaxID=72520 RepID=W7U217_9STRA|nr:hypothetical protein Naga_100001g59 [Nannochloropsis gaditana]
MKTYRSRKDWGRSQLSPQQHGKDEGMAVSTPASSFPLPNNSDDELDESVFTGGLARSKRSFFQHQSSRESSPFVSVHSVMADYASSAVGEGFSDRGLPVDRTLGGEGRQGEGEDAEEQTYTMASPLSHLKSHLCKSEKNEDIDLDENEQEDGIALETVSGTQANTLTGEGEDGDEKDGGSTRSNTTHFEGPGTESILSPSAEKIAIPRSEEEAEERDRMKERALEAQRLMAGLGSDDEEEREEDLRVAGSKSVAGRDEDMPSPREDRCASRGQEDTMDVEDLKGDTSPELPSVSLPHTRKEKEGRQNSESQKSFTAECETLVDANRPDSCSTAAAQSRSSLPSPAPLPSDSGPSIQESEGLQERKAIAVVRREGDTPRSGSGSEAEDVPGPGRERRRRPLSKKEKRDKGKRRAKKSQKAGHGQEETVTRKHEHKTKSHGSSAGAEMFSGASLDDVSGPNEHIDADASPPAVPLGIELAPSPPSSPSDANDKTQRPSPLSVVGGAVSEERNEAVSGLDLGILDSSQSEAEDEKGGVNFARKKGGRKPGASRGDESSDYEASSSGEDSEGDEEGEGGNGDGRNKKDDAIFKDAVDDGMDPIEKARLAVRVEELKELKKMEEQALVQKEQRELVLAGQKEMAKRTERLQSQLLDRIRARNRPLMEGVLMSATEQLKSLVRQKREEREAARASKLVEEAPGAAAAAAGASVEEEEVEEGFVEPPPEPTLTERLRQKEQEKAAVASSPEPNPASEREVSTEDDDSGDESGIELELVPAVVHADNNASESVKQSETKAPASWPRHDHGPRGFLCSRRSIAPDPSHMQLHVSTSLKKTAGPYDKEAALRRQLQEAARQRSAQWLARELGYKDYREHQRDLKIMELKRKAMAQRLKEKETAAAAAKAAKLLEDGVEGDTEGQASGDEEEGSDYAPDQDSDSDVSSEASVDTLEYRQRNGEEGDRATLGVDADEEERAAAAVLRQKRREEEEEEEEVGQEKENDVEHSDGDQEDNGDGGDGKGNEGENCAVEKPGETYEDHRAALLSPSAMEARSPGTPLSPSRRLAFPDRSKEALHGRAEDMTGRPAAHEGATDDRVGEAPPALDDSTSPPPSDESLQFSSVSAMVMSLPPPFTSAPTLADPMSSSKPYVDNDGQLKASTVQKGLTAFFGKPSAGNGSGATASCQPHGPDSISSPPKKGIAAFFSSKTTGPSTSSVLASLQQRTAVGAEGAEKGKEALKGRSDHTEDKDASDRASGVDESEERAAEPDDEEQDEETGEPRDRAAAYRAMIEADRRNAKRQKKLRKKGLVELEAEEEEEEEVLKGLEDFGFGAVNDLGGDGGAAAAAKRREENEDVVVREDDFEGIVDEVSEGEGDDDAFHDFAAQKEVEADKEQLQEVMRRVKEGFDGRRGGINFGARGRLRLDQLVGADRKSRREAKRLGLLNSDEELSSEDEGDDGEGGEEGEEDEEEDLEEQLIRAQRERVMGMRALETSAQYFMSSDDEDEDGEEKGAGESAAGAGEAAELEEERQERLRAKAWVRKAKMRRVLEEMEEQQLMQESQDGESIPGNGGEGAGKSGSGVVTTSRNAGVAAAKIRRVLQEADADSQHVMGLLERTHSTRMAASQSLKRLMDMREKDFSADIVDFQRLDPDHAMSNMSFALPPSKVPRTMSSTLPEREIGPLRVRGVASCGSGSRAEAGTERKENFGSKPDAKDLIPKSKTNYGSKQESGNGASNTTAGVPCLFSQIREMQAAGMTAPGMRKGSFISALRRQGSICVPPSNAGQGASVGIGGSSSSNSNGGRLQVSHVTAQKFVFTSSFLGGAEDSQSRGGYTEPSGSSQHGFSQSAGLEGSSSRHSIPRERNLSAGGRDKGVEGNCAKRSDKKTRALWKGLIRRQFNK